ncbi:hypothetical protein Pelo_19733 [Pelomyxa schiedti]|nr:hypothetical protein Pelo_19733 [Pelomyxa schiedti]
MGRGGATTFVGVLWSDWVRPTMRFLALEARGVYLPLFPGVTYPTQTQGSADRQVSDSLLCVSFRTNIDHQLVRFYHRDNLTHPLDLLPPGIHSNNTEETPKGFKPRRKFTADLGFVFKVHANVIDPTSGCDHRCLILVMIQSRYQC